MTNIKYIAALLIIASLYCCNPKGEIEIVPFELLNYERSVVDRGKTLHYKSEYFLVKNYSPGKKSEILIQQYVDEHKDSNLGTFSQYNMVFYKESRRTNVENIRKHPRDLDRYSQGHDLIFDFTWTRGEFVKRYEYKNGQMTGTDDIIIKEIDEKEMNQ